MTDTTKCPGCNCEIGDNFSIVGIGMIRIACGSIISADGGATRMLEQSDACKLTAITAERDGLRGELDEVAAERDAAKRDTNRALDMFATISRAVGNWREWPNEAVSDHEHPDWKAAARAILERDELLQSHAATKSERDKYDTELTACCQVLNRWPLASGCNGHLCVSGHLGNILDALDAAKAERDAALAEVAVLQRELECARGEIECDKQNREETSDYCDQLRRELAELRAKLAIAYSGFANLYTDDGELQDSRSPPIDFRRDSVAEIDRKMAMRAANQEQRQREATAFNNRQVADFQRRCMEKDAISPPSRE